jgi:hypothetical protein
MMMSREAFQKTIESFKQRQPFRPFVIELESGDCIVVQKPEEFHCRMGSGVYTRSTDGEMAFVEFEYVSRVIDAVPSAS